MNTTFKLTTGNEVNEMLIHHTMSDSLCFSSIEEAKKAFKKESDELKNTYKSSSDLDYSIDTVAESDKVRTRLLRITIEDDEIVECVTVFESETYVM